MKRFYCTKCERHRRVRRLPPGVSETDRIGQCGWHGLRQHRQYVRNQQQLGTRPSVAVRTKKIRASA